MKWEQAASTAMFVSLSRFHFGCNAQKKEKKKCRTRKLINFMKVIWKRCFSFKHFKELLKVPAEACAKDFLPGKSSFISQGRSSSLLLQTKPTFTAKSLLLHRGAGAEGAAPPERSPVSAAVPAPGKARDLPNSWERERQPRALRCLPSTRTACPGGAQVICALFSELLPPRCASLHRTHPSFLQLDPC